MFQARWIKSGGVGALILAGVVLSVGQAHRFINLRDQAPTTRSLARVSEKQESDAPPPGFLMRRFGFGTAPAIAKVPLAPDAPAAPAAVSNWVSLGPTQITDVGSNSIFEPSLGRVNCIAVSPVDPNRLLAGAGSGGVWISGDGGQVWTPRGDNLPVLGVTDIKFAPSDPNIVYMTTGDANAFATPSVGVYKSTDGGLTWNPTGLTFTEASFTILTKLAIDPSNPNIVYTASRNFLHRTTDGGATWIQSNPSGVVGGDFPAYDVKLRPGSPSVVYFMGPNGDFRRSFDSGASFTPRSPGIPTSVQRC